MFVQFIPLVIAPCLSLPSSVILVSLICLCAASVLGPYLRDPLGQLSKLPDPWGLLCFVLLPHVNGEIQLAQRKEVLQQAEFQLKWGEGLRRTWDDDKKERKKESRCCMG
jgi:hypothetical protein